MFCKRENKVSLQENERFLLPAVPRHPGCKPLHRKTEAPCLTTLRSPLSWERLRSSVACAPGYSHSCCRQVLGAQRQWQTAAASWNSTSQYTPHNLLSVSWPSLPTPACCLEVSLFAALPAPPQFYQAKQRRRWDLSLAVATAAISVSSWVCFWGLELGWAPTCQ